MMVLRHSKQKIWMTPGNLWKTIFRFPESLRVQTVGDGVKAQTDADTMNLPEADSECSSEVVNTAFDERELACQDPEPEPESVASSDSSSSWWAE